MTVTDRSTPTAAAPRLEMPRQEMSAWIALKLIMKREMRSRILAKPFLIGLLVSAALIFAVFGLGEVLGGDDPFEIGVVGTQPASAVDNLEVIVELDGSEVNITTLADRQAAEQALTSGDIDAVVINGSELLMDETSQRIVTLVTPAWQQAQLVEELGAAGLSGAEIGGALSSAVPLEVVELNPDPESDARNAVAFASVILLFIAVQVAGAYIMMGVFEEKTTKVVELVLSSIPARYLLMGKVVGIGVLGLIQVLVLAGSAVVGASIFGSSALPALSVSLIGTGIIWFILGYLLYGSLFAAGASLAPRQEDAQATLAPVSVILMLSYFASIFVATNPKSLGAQIVSWLPFASPFTMPGRTASGDALWWEVVGSMVVTALTATVILLLAERIYVRSIIHTDRKLTWKEAWSMKS